MREGARLLALLALSLVLLGSTGCSRKTPAAKQQDDQTTSADFSKVLLHTPVPPKGWTVTTSGWTTKSDLWNGATLKPSDWVFLGVFDEDNLVFYHPPILRPPGELPRLWVRYESPMIPMLMASTKELVEAECAVDHPNRPLRTRVLQSISYPRNNLDGDAGVSSAEPNSWVYVGAMGDPRGTVNQVIQQLACDSR